jgi:hypothetical protein
MDHSKRCLYEMIVMVYKPSRADLTGDQLVQFETCHAQLNKQDCKTWADLPYLTHLSASDRRKIYDDAVYALSHDARIAAATQLAAAIEEA